MQTAVDEIDVGIWEKDAAAKVSAAQIAGMDTFGGSSPAIFPIMPSAKRTSSAHLTFDPDRQYRKNCDVYLSSMVHKEEMNGVYRKFFATDPPARNTVAVAGLDDNLDVEIEVIAAAD